MTLTQLFLESSQDEHEPKKPITFTGSTNQVSHLADIFSSITTINTQALMVISLKGINIFAEYNHILNAHLTIDPSLFSTYNIYSEDDGPTPTSLSDLESQELRLGIDISLIAESFSAAATTGSKGGNAASGSTNVSAANNNDNVVCYIKYNGEGHPLIIEFEDRLMNEKIEFLTFYLDIRYPYDPNEIEDEEQYDLIVNPSEIHFEVILRSDVFTNLLQDLQQINTVDLYIFVSNKYRNLGEKPGQPSRNYNRVAFMDNQLNFISKGAIGHLKLLFPNHKVMLEKLDIFKKNQSDEMIQIQSSLITCYNFTNFIKIFKAVKLSSKCKIMKDLSGILSVQLLCKNPKLPNYAGTLITFNMLEISTVTDEFGTDDITELSLNNIFDDDFYEYIREYNNNGTAKTRPPNDVNEDYEDLALMREQQAARKPSEFASLLTKDGVPQLTYDSFRQAPQNKEYDDIQVDETVYDPPSSKKPNNNNNKKRQKRDSGKSKTVEAVGDAFEVPLFL